MADYQQKSKYTRAEIDAHLDRARGVSNPNLIDNWYFANPVDQRGGYVITPNTRIYSDAGLTNLLATAGPNEYVQIQTVTEITDTYAKFIDSGGSVRYTEAAQAPVRGYTGAGYGLDRWKMYDLASVLIYDDGIILTTNGTQYGRIVQLMDAKFKAGMVVTLSVLVEEMSTTGAWYMKLSYQDTSGTEKYIGYTLLSVGLNMVTVNIPDDYDSKYPMLARFPNNRSVAGDMIKLKAAKLELGDHQTLAHQDENGNWVLNDPPPDRAVELMKCQRYFVNLSLDASLCCIANGINNGNFQIAIFEIPTPVTMAKTPVITDVKKKGRIIFPSGEAVKVTNVFVDTVHAASVRVYLSNTGNSSYVPVALEDYGFSFSADL